MGSGTSAVLVVSWWEPDLHPVPSPLQRRMHAMRTGLSERLTALNVPHGQELVRAIPDARTAARQVIDRLCRLDRPVIVCCDWDIPPEEFARLEDLHRSGDARVLILSTAETQVSLPAIVYQQSGVGGDVARHCLAAGYQRLIYISPFRSTWSDARAEGVLSAARHARVPVHVEPSVAAPDLHRHGADSSVEQEQRLLRALDRSLAAVPLANDEYTAIIGCNDRIIWGLRALRPDLCTGFAGFDDEISTARHDITSARPPAEELIRRGAEFAARLWRGEHIPTLTELPWDLIARSSTRRSLVSTRVRRRHDDQLQSRKPKPISDVVPACPPVVLITWGAVSGQNANTIAHAGRLDRITNSLTRSLARDQVELAILPIDLLLNSDDMGQQMERAARRAVKGGAKVVIIQELTLTDQAEFLLAEERAAGRLQIVRSLTTNAAPDQPVVLHDQGAAGVMAAAHCLRQNYRRMLYLAPFSSSWSEERGLSSRRALVLASSGLSTLLISPEVPEFDSDGFLRLDQETRRRVVAQAFDAGCARLDALGGAASPPAVIAANDDVALLLLAELTARGLRIGIDVGLVGFDDLPECAEAGITSLSPPMEALGSELARVVMRLLAGGSVPRRTCLPWTLEARKSSVQAPA